MKETIKLLTQNSCDPDIYERLADEYLKTGRLIPAAAEYRSSIALGSQRVSAYSNLISVYMRMGYVVCARAVCSSALNLWGNSHAGKQFEQMMQQIMTLSESDCTGYSHNTYYRLKTISDHLLSLHDSGKFSVLDIGGGEGALSLFMPEADYVLVEPGINGLSAMQLGFPDKSFSCAAACHVLEHILPGDREKFLDQLCSKVRDYVILLNPFYMENDHKVEELVYEVSGESWAKEHIDCTLPKIEDIERYALERGIGCRVIPNGSQALSAAVVFLDYFAVLSGRTNEWSRVNQFLNRYRSDEIENNKLPNAYLIELKVNTD